MNNNMEKQKLNLRYQAVLERLIVSSLDERLSEDNQQKFRQLAEVFESKLLSIQEARSSLTEIRFLSEQLPKAIFGRQSEGDVVNKLN